MFYEVNLENHSDNSLIDLDGIKIIKQDLLFVLLYAYSIFLC